MKILLVSHELSVTGAPNSLLRQAKYFLEAGHEVSVWTLSDGDLRPRYEDVGLNPVLIENSRSLIAGEFEKLARRPDFIVCNTIRTYRAVDVLQRFGIPVVWFIRETRLLDEDMWTDPGFAAVFRRFYNLYTVSEYNAEIIRRYNANVRVVHNAVGDRFTGFSELGEGVRFGFIGSIMPVKGVDVLLKAFAKVKAEEPGCTLRIAGRPWTDFGRNMFAEYSLAPGVEWVGEVQGSSKDEFFASVDVLCVPSLDEPSGLTVIEGAMYGKAVITTDCTGANYLVSGSSGRVVAAGDVEALAAAMLELVRKRRELPELQRCSRESYLEAGTVDVERVAVLKMLNDNIDNPPVVGYRLGNDRPSWFFHEDRTLSGHRRFWLFGCKVFSCRGRGVYGGDGKPARKGEMRA